MIRKKHLLFVCNANLNRSPTAEGLFRDNRKYEAKSCEINPLSVIVIDKHSIMWTDIIFCMEKSHKDFILENFSEAKGKKIIILNIKDIYIMNDPRLIVLLRKKLKRFL